MTKRPDWSSLRDLIGSIPCPRRVAFTGTFAETSDRSFPEALCPSTRRSRWRLGLRLFAEMVGSMVAAPEIAEEEISWRAVGS